MSIPLCKVAGILAYPAAPPVMVYFTVIVVASVTNRTFKPAVFFDSPHTPEGTVADALSGKR